MFNMFPLCVVATLSLLVQYTLSQGPNSADSPTPTDYPGTESPYLVIPTGTDIPPGASGSVAAQNKVGTFLYSYDGCSNFPGAKDKINGAYYDSWVIANTAGVNSDIDWNNAAALEYLGAPGLNTNAQPQIQAVFANMATMIYSYKNPFQHYIKVRCDDPLKRCQNRPDQDPCNPTPPNPDQDPGPTPLAYSRNSDPDSANVPMINFCDGFLNRRSLADGITYGTGLNNPANLQLANYDNRAQSFFHELLHLNLAADSPTPNPAVTDLTIQIQVGNRGNTLTSVAYGPFMTKTLARWQGSNNKVGYYVQRNADNLAYYALAKYVTGKNNNIYPHLPIVSRELNGPPYEGLLADFDTNGTNFYLNTTDDLSTFETDWSVNVGEDYPGCSDDENPDENADAGPLININGFTPNSAYPDDYNSQVSSWVAALSTAAPSPSSSAPPPSSTAAAPPAYATGICSFHLTETQDCNPDSSNLFAIIGLKDGKGNDIGDTTVNPTTDPIGDSINVGSSYSFTSKLPNPLVVTGEHENDYIQFTYGTLSWQSKTPNGGAHCNNGGWDPRDGPICGLRFGNRNAVNNMDCFFPC